MSVLRIMIIYSILLELLLEPSLKTVDHEDAEQNQQL
jgi:hypothetical protein